MVALVVPLVILAVPFLDTGFVIAKRLKYRRKPWSADANHFHHRMARIGFSQRKTVAYLYGWTLLLAGAGGRAAVDPVPRPPRPATTSAGSLLMVALALVALAASVYLVYVLEIFKFKGLRDASSCGESTRTPASTRSTSSVERDIETGEFERVRIVGADGEGQPASS